MDTIGSKLKAAREKLSMTQSDVAKAIRVRTDYVIAIEKNEFYKLVAPVYARGFIKLYAQCVQLSPLPLLRQFDALVEKEEPQVAKPEHRKETPALKKHRRVSFNFAGLVNTLVKIRLPDVRWLKIPAWPFFELPNKKWLVLVAAAVIGIILLPILIRQVKLPVAKIRAPASCRWIANPPEPYLDIPAPKTQNSR
jgi:transcriptional regulator with XRE-family HTH domain